MAWAALALTVGGKVLQGQEAQRAANFKAAQLKQQSASTRATAQRESIEQNRQSKLIQSRALAVASASGGGALDPDVVRIISGIAGEGDYRARSALYEGDTRANSLDAEAQASIQSGKAAARSSYISAAGSVIESPEGRGALETGFKKAYTYGRSMYEKYG